MMSDKYRCPGCKKPINWVDEKTFILEYRDPKARPNPKQKNIVFIHPTCWVNAAGEEWAQEIGYYANQQTL